MASRTREVRMWLRTISIEERKELRRLRSTPPILQLAGTEQHYMPIAAFDRLLPCGTATERAETFSLCSIAPREEKEQDDE